MKIIALATALLLAAAAANLAAGEAPPPPSQAGPVPAKWDMPASALTAIKGSLSPDGRYAIAYPKASEADLKLARNLVVSFKPFRVLTVLEDDGMSAGSKRLSVEVEWTADSSKVIVTTKHDKWDMIVGASLVEIRDGQVALRVNLLNAINQELIPDFRKAKAEAYNDMLPFILTESKVSFDAGGKLIQVKTAACNDPNEARKIEWNARFEGAWNIADGKWQNQKLTSKSQKNPQL